MKEILGKLEKPKGPPIDWSKVEKRAIYESGEIEGYCETHINSTGKLKMKRYLDKTGQIETSKVEYVRDGKEDIIAEIWTENREITGRYVPESNEVDGVKSKTWVWERFENGKFKKVEMLEQTLDELDGYGELDE